MESRVRTGVFVMLNRVDWEIMLAAFIACAVLSCTTHQGQQGVNVENLASKDDAGDAEVFVSFAVGDISISDAFMYPPSAWSPNGFPHVTVTNHSKESDELIGVTCRRAATVRLVERVQHGDTLNSRYVESFRLEGESSITIQPRGKAIFLLGLEPTPAVGDHLEIELVFRNAGPIGVTLPIIAR